MAKLYKISFYLVDFDDTYIDAEGITDDIDGNLDGIVKVIETQESEDIEWRDDIDVNHIDAPLEQFEAYFRNK